LLFGTLAFSVILSAKAIKCSLSSGEPGESYSISGTGYSISGEDYSISGEGSSFAFVQKTDSLSVLTLRTDSTFDRWELPFPTYRFCAGDLNGDGQDEAMVGVIKATRFYPEPARRLYIFKNVRGRIRPLWMGSKLGGILQDFRYVGGRVRSLETDKGGRYYVAEYSLRTFGLAFDRFLLQAASRDEAMAVFLQE
jgi:hypothetical protein